MDKERIVVLDVSKEVKALKEQQRLRGTEIGRIVSTTMYHDDSKILETGKNLVLIYPHTMEFNFKEYPDFSNEIIKDIALVFKNRPYIDIGCEKNVFRIHIISLAGINANVIQRFGILIGQKLELVKYDFRYEYDGIYGVGVSTEHGMLEFSSKPFVRKHEEEE